MSPILLFFGSIYAAFLAWFIWQRLQRTRRNKLFLKPLPPEWIQLLETNVALVALLPEDLRKELHGRINIFLDEKEFIGCAGLEISDEIRITIAGNACLLLLKRDKRCFPGFTSILVYPDTYVSREVQYDGIVQVNKDSVRAGESWHRGPIVLSWTDVMRGTLNHSEGHNVVLHEFAPKLDEENEIMDGLPVLRDSSDYAEWAEVLSKEYESLLIRVEKRSNKVIDEYGAVSPPEFFAVATESFFEKPTQMKKKLPDLYRQFKKFYNLDPASWRKPS
jgi:Mlc titration factor MtfA (ptsG expression regulator)